MWMVTDKIEQNNAKVQWGTALQNKPNYNSILATKLQPTELSFISTHKIK